MAGTGHGAREPDLGVRINRVDRRTTALERAITRRTPVLQRAPDFKGYQFRGDITVPSGDSLGFVTWRTTGDLTYLQGFADGTFETDDTYGTATGLVTPGSSYLWQGRMYADFGSTTLTDGIMTCSGFGTNYEDVVTGDSDFYRMNLGVTVIAPTVPFLCVAGALAMPGPADGVVTVLLLAGTEDSADYANSFVP